MPYKPKEVEALLETKFGFTPAPSHEKNHTWYVLMLPELPPIRTKVEHHRRPIGSKLEGRMARQMRVRPAFYRQMLDCTQSCENYYSKVREDPYPPFEILVFY